MIILVFVLSFIVYGGVWYLGMAAANKAKAVAKKNYPQR